MATKIKTLKNRLDTIFPRTVSKAVIMEDGTSLEYSAKNISTDSIKISDSVSEATGKVSGTTLSSFLVDQANSTANTLASAEIVE